MAGAECIVAVDVSEGGQLASEGSIAFLFAFVESKIFQKQHFAVFQRGNLGCGIGVDGVSGKCNRLAQQSRENCGGWLQAELGKIFAVLRLSQVTAEYQLAASVDDGLDRRNRHPDSSIVCHVALVVERNVEVDSHEDCLA